MVLTRVQASDFQDAGIEGNFSKLEVAVTFAKKAKARFDDVGDTFDTHYLNDFLKQGGEKNTAEFLKKNPAAKAKKSEMEKILEKIERRSEKLEEKDISELSRIYEELAKIGYFKAVTKDISPAIKEFYQRVGKLVEPLGDRAFIIRGNNDTSSMQEEVKSAVFPELSDKLVEDGPFAILGMNNTNYPGEDAFAPYGMSVPSDTNTAYGKFNVAKAGKRANIVMMHDPVSGKRDGEEDIIKLLDEHVPEEGILLIEAGHTHKLELSFRKNEKGTGGVVMAISSPEYFFEHRFDDAGKYISTGVYRYK